MFQGEDCYTIQTLVKKGMIIPMALSTPKAVLDAIQSTIKEEKHFWHDKDESYLSKARPNPYILLLLSVSLNLSIKCKFSNNNLKETFQIILPQHPVW